MLILISLILEFVILQTLSKLLTDDDKHKVAIFLLVVFVFTPTEVIEPDQKIYIIPIVFDIVLHGSDFCWSKNLCLLNTDCYIIPLLS